MSDGVRFVAEAALFSTPSPLKPHELARLLPRGTDVEAIVARLNAEYEGRGLVVSLTRAGYAIRTAPMASDLAAAFADPAPRLSRPALETLACIAAFEEAGAPLTRAEIERVRGVGLSAGILDALMEAGYVRTGRRRETRGRPLTWLTTEHFHDAYGLAALSDLPACREMLEAGLCALAPYDPAAEEAAEAGDAPP